MQSKAISRRRFSRQGSRLRAFLRCIRKKKKIKGKRQTDMAAEKDRSVVKKGKKKAVSKTGKAAAGKTTQAQGKTREKTGANKAETRTKKTKPALAAPGAKKIPQTAAARAAKIIPKAAGSREMKTEKMIKEELLKRKEDIIKEAKAEIARHVSGDAKQIVETALDDGDWSVIDLSEGINLKRLETHRDMLLGIDESLRKIKEGTYGVCEDCGNKIGMKRLKVMPFAIYCRDCQEKKETFEKIEREEFI